MKLIRLSFLTALQAVFLTSCVFGGGFSSGGGSLIVSESKSGPEKSSKKSKKQTGPCADDSACEDICEETYGDFSKDEEENEGRVERCLDLSYSVVDSFYDIVAALEEPAFSRFQNIDGKHFGAFLDVSVKPWIEFIKDMKRSESEILLRWIASEKRVADGIVAAYTNYEDFKIYNGVYRLLMDLAPDLSKDQTYRGNTKEQVKNRNCAEICRAIHESSIGGGKSFWDIADKANNTVSKNIGTTLKKEVCDSTDDDVCNTHLSP